jgi:hypothetical protein
MFQIKKSIGRSLHGKEIEKIWRPILMGCGARRARDKAEGKPWDGSGWQTAPLRLC